MNSENLPKTEDEPYNPNLDAQDEDVMSGGNNKLTYILIGVILALVLAYVALPKGGGSGMASVMPTFMLDDAAVTATAPTAADSITASLKAAPVVAEEENTLKAPKTTTKTTTATPPAQAAVAPAVAAAAAPVEVAPAPAPAPVAAPEPAAPTTVTMSGKIEDENGRPLVGATVLLKGSSKGTSTDANGNYTMEVPSGDNTLVYGYGGYDDEVLRNSGGKPVNVTLTPRAKTSRKRR